MLKERANVPERGYAGPGFACSSSSDSAMSCRLNEYDATSEVRSSGNTTLNEGPLSGACKRTRKPTTPIALLTQHTVPFRGWKCIYACALLPFYLADLINALDDVLEDLEQLVVRNFVPERSHTHEPRGGHRHQPRQRLDRAVINIIEMEERAFEASITCMLVMVR